MKKLLIALMALVLAALTALPALADVPYTGTIPLYVNRSKIYVYKEQTKESKKLKTLKGASKVLPELVSDDGEWYGVLIEDTKHGGQKMGWIRSEAVVDYYPQSFCEHKWGEWTVEKKATCTEKGYRWRLCTLCGIRDEQETKKKEHDWSNWKVVKEATCSKKGERTRTCKVCGKEEKEEYYDEHTFGAWEMTKEPT